MRVAAGVLLIVAAALNLFGGLGYLVGGGLASGSGAFMNKVADEMEASTASDPNAPKIDRTEMNEATGKIAAAGGLLMAFGLYLLVACGVMITGAVYLFKGKAATFIFVAAAMAIIAEAAGMGITGFGPMKLPGIVAGIFAVIGAMDIKKKAAPVAQEATPAA